MPYVNYNLNLFVLVYRQEFYLASVVLNTLKMILVPYALLRTPSYIRYLVFPKVNSTPTTLDNRYMEFMKFKIFTREFYKNIWRHSDFAENLATVKGLYMVTYKRFFWET